MSERPEQPERLPNVEDVLVSTVVSLVNLGGIRLTDKEHRDLGEAKAAIDAARALMPLCPEEGMDPVKDALSQLQMVYVKEAGGPAKAPDERAREEDERAKARSKIWTPPGA
jgi:hypothetical protein